MVFVRLLKFIEFQDVCIASCAQTVATAPKSSKRAKKQHHRQQMLLVFSVCKTACFSTKAKRKKTASNQPSCLHQCTQHGCLLQYFLTPATRLMHRRAVVHTHTQLYVHRQMHSKCTPCSWACARAVFRAEESVCLPSLAFVCPKALEWDTIWLPLKGRSFVFTFTLVIFAEPSANTWQSNRLRANETETTAVNSAIEKERAEEAISTHQQQQKQRKVHYRNRNKMIAVDLFRTNR